MSDEMENDSTRGSDPIAFKSRKRKNLRKRRRSEEEEDANPEGACDLNFLEEIKERQKLRKRSSGVSLLGLAIGKKLAVEEEITIKDPFNVKTSGGLVNMTALKSGKLKEPDDAYDVGIGTQFSAETNKRDEDEEMMKYIEKQLQQRKGVAKNVEDVSEADPKYMTPEEAALYSLPDHLRQSSSNRSEEMLSNQMLNGIPEVDLGIEAKIRNIEETEEAKQKLLQDRKNKIDGPSQFVPTNMAVNFMRHNRFNIDDNSNSDRGRRRRENEETSKQPLLDTYNHVYINGLKRATDDYHYDKFKRQFRRY